MGNTKSNYKAKMHHLRSKLRRGETISAHKLELLRQYEDNCAETMAALGRPYERITVPSAMAATGGQTTEQVIEQRAAAGVPITDPTTTEQRAATVEQLANNSTQAEKASDAVNGPPTAPVPPRPEPSACPYCGKDFTFTGDQWAEHWTSCMGEGADKFRQAAKARADANGHQAKPEPPQQAEALPVEPEASEAPKGPQNGANGAGTQLPKGAASAQAAVLLKRLNPEKLAKMITKSCMGMSKAAQAEGLITLPDFIWPIYEELLESFIQEKVDGGLDLRTVRTPVLLVGGAITVVQGARAAKIRQKREAGTPSEKPNQPSTEGGSGERGSAVAGAHPAPAAPKEPMRAKAEASKGNPGAF